ncbi:MAG: hypothetical protein IJ083_06640 [Clostridia bacterium]|nr:hypothetical protein [Clostridia bacterium]
MQRLTQPKNILDMPSLKIMDGHMGQNYFWILPVRCPNYSSFLSMEVEECHREEISVEDTFVEHCLKDFFLRHFDSSLPYNRRRQETLDGPDPEHPVFEWYLVHNFYTPDSILSMVREIRWYAGCLGKARRIRDIPSAVQPEIRCFAQALPDLWNARQSEFVRFYLDFADRLENMLRQSTDWPLIGIMGP